MKKPLINWLGLLGIISLLSYSAAVLVTPLAYPGYNWMEQAVSDLSATKAPSLMLWNQLASLYNLCGLISIMMVCVFIQKKLNKTIRLGIYLFAMMNWVSAVGYSIFPLIINESVWNFQNIMHIAVTGMVVLLSISSLVIIMLGGYRNQQYVSLAAWATVALLIMVIGAIGTAIVPAEFFGIPERFSVFSATGFNAILGIYLFMGFSENT
ncbi:DUF998 domain-containing protein [Marinilactibacillus psychrotolerans]|uniref:DUF998 domain-containing protein n=1 Tax=Marinilactibacillus psychrotolerans TaxID=191770 RepID=A0AAV3WRW5_9LACT|nr:DUF998 domain-containing protein [Marinilactibacillus psychrotolerans]GEL66691.1 hypothetical protein MPS01_08460 [Marinilactibacillus psychrotolerans]GEQ35213.1 hypothetical protein M132T_07210 [Marinilactibacillus psychrotolerans]SDD24123.1 Protein of unknown function [Marinilactibacillus psychrotolerans]